MVSVDKIYSTFLSNGVDFFTGVPDSLLKNICAYITDHTPKEKNIIAANEGAALGIAAGYHMASGKLPLIYMQNSGLGNAVNPLLSLADEKVYSLPVLLMIGWRGEPSIKDEPQHVKQGEVTLALLDAMQVPYIILDTDEEKALVQISEMIRSAKSLNRPHAIVIRKGTFGKYKLKNESCNHFPVSRELFEYREQISQGHEKDFLTVGSMGHSSSIALGIAIEKGDRNVFCLDGDGAFIMHMGALSNIGSLGVKNFKHILFNNGSHESVGGQPTLGFQINIPAIAGACGYKKAIIATTREEILSAMDALSKTDGPALLEIKIKIDSRENLGRPTTTPVENKKDFMNFLKNN